MIKVMAILAGAMPEDFLISRVIEALNDYKDHPSEDTKKMCIIHMTVLHMKLENGDDIEASLKDIRNVEEARNLYNITRNFPQQ